MPGKSSTSANARRAVPQGQGTPSSELKSTTSNRWGDRGSDGPLPLTGKPFELNRRRLDIAPTRHRPTRHRALVVDADRGGQHGAVTLGFEPSTVTDDEPAIVTLVTRKSYQTSAGAAITSAASDPHVRRLGAWHRRVPPRGFGALSGLIFDAAVGPTGRSNRPVRKASTNW